MVAAWETDIKKFAPHLSVTHAFAGKRARALKSASDVVVVNEDGVKELLSMDKRTWKGFGRVVIDESEVFKHHTSQRSKAMGKLIKYFPIRRCMSGTPATNTICDIWHQYKLLDDGKRLGSSFSSFRFAACEYKMIDIGSGRTAPEWKDREGIEQTIALAVKDITVRHKFEDCVDIPPNHTYSVSYTLPEEHMKSYLTMEKEKLLELQDATITAINAGSAATKLLQIASGAVYNTDNNWSEIDTGRYELIADLIEARKHSVCFFLWHHQRENIIKTLEKRNISYLVWDSNKPDLAQRFQNGEFQCLLAHPASAAHGLTLTRAASTIWASPTYNLSWSLQGMRRIYRIGQKEKTETIVVIAKDTIDEKVWVALQGKEVNLKALLMNLMEDK
jgi:SNF2 family DNA or RNA helicase